MWPCPLHFSTVGCRTRQHFNTGTLFVELLCTLSAYTRDPCEGLHERGSESERERPREREGKRSRHRSTHSPRSLPCLCHRWCNDGEHTACQFPPTFHLHGAVFNPTHRLSQVQLSIKSLPSHPLDDLIETWFVGTFPCAALSTQAKL